MIKLNGILYDINTLNTKAASGDADSPRARDSSVVELSAALDSWLAELPADMKYSPDNLQYWADQGCGTAFAVLYLNFHHAGQLLFYRFLHSNLTPDSHHPAGSNTYPNRDIDPRSSSSAHYAARCQSHAAHLSDIMYSASGQHEQDNHNNEDDIHNKTAPPVVVEVRHPLAGHMLVVASTVHTYTLLFSGDEAEIVRARARLERSFGVVSRLRAYWPSLAASFSRLAAVHAACLGPSRIPGSSGGAHGGGGSDGNGDGGDGKGAFRLDRWMLRFLVDFAKPVDFAERGPGARAPASGYR